MYPLTEWNAAALEFAGIRRAAFRERGTWRGHDDARLMDLWLSGVALGKRCGFLFLINSWEGSPS